MKRVLAAALTAVIAVFAAPTPAGATIAPNAEVRITVNKIRSVSNMLVSFESKISGQIFQVYVCEGCVYGEGGYSYTYAEPQRVWINAGWCGSIWRNGVGNYYRGGSTGLSVPIHPGRYATGVYSFSADLYYCPA